MQCNSPVTDTQRESKIEKWEESRLRILKKCAEKGIPSRLTSMLMHEGIFSQ